MTCLSDDYFSESQPHGWLSVRNFSKLKKISYEESDYHISRIADGIGSGQRGAVDGGDEAW